MSEGQPVVFIVDDDESVCRGFARLLRAHGYQTRTFATAHEFLAHTADHGPGCLVLDLMLPGLSGLHLQGKLAEAGRTIPIVFISGHGDVPSSVAAMKAGALDFLTKPVKEGALLEAVRRAVERDIQARTEREAAEGVHARLAALTPREREVMALVVTGMLNKQVAFALGITEKTVKVHRGNVMEKLGVSSLADLVRLAERAGLGPPGK